MRAVFTHTLVELAERDPRVVLLTGDLGYTVLEPFAERFPDRFINAGVAEQNMVGIATGLAEAGFIPFVYSIVPFAVLRPFEFIRNGPIAHHLPVRVVGVGGGFEYSTNGISHYGLEDVGLMRTQPGMTVLTPADPNQARATIMATWDRPGPIYYRLGKDDKAAVPGLHGRFSFGKCEIIGDGQDVLLVAMGAAAGEAVVACEMLRERGVHGAVLVVSTMNPAPTADLVSWLSRYQVAVTVEAHYVTGGLGSLVAETVAEQGIACRVVRCGVRQQPDGVSGSFAYMRERYGLSPRAIAQATSEALVFSRRRAAV